MINDQEVLVDLNQPLDISVPIKHGALNPNCYNSPTPVILPVKNKDFIGSVSGGGPCNHNTVSITPHGNGTHTECYGHISSDPGGTINQCLNKFHFIARLISVRPVKSEEGDLVVPWDALRPHLNNSTAEALIIRTLPNHYNKMTRQYSGTNPPYLENGLAKNLVEHKIRHLLVDLPSVDKESDGGKLLSHHHFWDYPGNPRTDCTITELIYVPDTIPDGAYLLNLQIISLDSDASPSKPVLYSILSSDDTSC